MDGKLIGDRLKGISNRVTDHILIMVYMVNTNCSAVLMTAAEILTVTATVSYPTTH